MMLFVLHLKKIKIIIAGLNKGQMSKLLMDLTVLSGLTLSSSLSLIQLYLPHLPQVLH